MQFNTIYAVHMKRMLWVNECIVRESCLDSITVVGICNGVWPFKPDVRIPIPTFDDWSCHE